MVILFRILAGFRFASVGVGLFWLRTFIGVGHVLFQAIIQLYCGSFRFFLHHGYCRFSGGGRVPGCFLSAHDAFIPWGKGRVGGSR